MFVIKLNNVIEVKSEEKACALLDALEKLGVYADYEEAEEETADCEEETLYEVESRIYSYGRI